jgi:LysR family hydrogen peroxide-inducible transcriptional activator
VLNKKVLIPNDIDANHLWLLEEGHCLRSQALNICEMRTKDLRSGILEYNAGSIDSLIKLVDQNEGITILPELAVHYMNAKQKACIRRFKAPTPVREICIVTNKRFVKTRIRDILCREITDNIQELLVKKPKERIVER